MLVRRGHGEPRNLKYSTARWHSRTLVATRVRQGEEAEVPGLLAFPHLPTTVCVVGFLKNVFHG